MLSDAELEAIRTATWRASRGPWEVIESRHKIPQHNVRQVKRGHGVLGADLLCELDDANFIAGARSWVPALLADREALVAECDALRESREWWRTTRSDEISLDLAALRHQNEVLREALTGTRTTLAFWRDAILDGERRAGFRALGLTALADRAALAAGEETTDA